LLGYIDGAIGYVILLVEEEMNDDAAVAVVVSVLALVSDGRDAANAAARLTPVSCTFSSGALREGVSAFAASCPLSFRLFCTTSFS
jgi:hypothetical protein